MRSGNLTALPDGTTVAQEALDAYGEEELSAIARFLRDCGLDVTVLEIPLS